MQSSDWLDKKTCHFELYSDYYIFCQKAFLAMKKYATKMMHQISRKITEKFAVIEAITLDVRKCPKMVAKRVVKALLKTNLQHHTQLLHMKLIIVAILIFLLKHISAKHVVE